MSPGDSRLGRRRASGRLAWLLVGPPLVLGAIRHDDNGVVADEIRRHVAWLADDARAGRFPGTPGAEAAAQYIASELERSGLHSLGRDTGYFRPVPLHATRPDATSELFLVSGCGSGPLRLGEDFLLYSGGVQALIPQAVPLVFVGYGIVAPEFAHDDYAGLDVAGKVVVVLEGEPVSNDPEYFAGPQPTVYSAAEAKQRTALSRGARGSLLIPSALLRQRPWEDQRRDFAFEHVSLAYSLPRHLSVRLREGAAARLFCGAPLDLEEVHRREREGAARSFELSARVWFRADFQERDFVSANVAALWPGSDPELRDTYVLVSAHYDHLGVGPEVDGDRIYNGAIDNAIGVAGVLEMARVLAARPSGPRRSVLFLFTTAEEEGLLGAIYYVDHPLVPLHRTVANVNVDGLAHVARFADVIGIGAELSSLGASLEAVATRRGLGVSPPPPLLARSDAFAYSDQAAFAEAGIPAILVNEGFRWTDHTPEDALARFIRWVNTRYHRPSDDLSQPLNIEATRQHVELLLDLVVELADDPEPPRWSPGSPGELAQRRTREEGR